MQFFGVKDYLPLKDYSIDFLVANWTHLCVTYDWEFLNILGIISSINETVSCPKNKEQRRFGSSLPLLNSQKIMFKPKNAEKKKTWLLPQMLLYNNPPLHGPRPKYQKITGSTLTTLTTLHTIAPFFTWFFFFFIL